MRRSFGLRVHSVVFCGLFLLGAGGNRFFCSIIQLGISKWLVG